MAITLKYNNIPSESATSFVTFSDVPNLVEIDNDATGGTMAAAYELVKSLNPKKVYVNFVVELTGLNGRSVFPADAEITSLITY